VFITTDHMDEIHNNPARPQDLTHGSACPVLSFGLEISTRVRDSELSCQAYFLRYHACRPVVWTHAGVLSPALDLHTTARAHLGAACYFLPLYMSAAKFSLAIPCSFNLLSTNLN